MNDFHGTDLSFTPNARPTLGIELELQLVDPETLELKNVIGAVLAGLPKEQEWAKPELMQSYLEINSRVCGSIEEARRDLAEKIARVQIAARQAGAELLWAGTHPFSIWMDQKVSPNLRYQQLVENLQDTARRIVTFGMHVHVGVDSGDKAVMLVDRLMRYLATLLAVSVNSPFWVGRQTGLHSQRCKIMEQLPAAGTPPMLRNYSEYCWVVNHSIQNGTISSIQEIWWDVRPHPRFGTVEIRICDLPPNLEDALAIAALCQCLVAVLSEQIDEGVYQHDIHPIMVRQNKWKATRYGMRAELIDPVSHKTIPVREMVYFLYEKLHGHAEALGCAVELSHLLNMLERPSGAERQMALYEATGGDLREVVRRLVAETAAPPSPERPAHAASHG
jgi:glutamate---cysteine ligase / carboxylate-amine ligase